MFGILYGVNRISNVLWTQKKNSNFCNVGVQILSLGNPFHSVPGPASLELLGTTVGTATDGCVRRELARTLHLCWAEQLVH